MPSRELPLAKFADTLEKVIPEIQQVVPKEDQKDLIVPIRRLVDHFRSAEPLLTPEAVKRNIEELRGAAEEEDGLSENRTALAERIIGTIDTYE